MTMPMSLGDRVFWSIVTIILVGLLWVKFVEQYLDASWALVIGLVLAALIIIYGNQIKLERLIKRGTGKATEEH